MFTRTATEPTISCKLLPEADLLYRHDKRNYLQVRYNFMHQLDVSLLHCLFCIEDTIKNATFVCPKYFTIHLAIRMPIFQAVNCELTNAWTSNCSTESWADSALDSFFLRQFNFHSFSRPGSLFILINSYCNVQDHSPNKNPIRFVFAANQCSSTRIRLRKLLQFATRK